MGLMIAFDFVILVVIVLSRNLEVSAWKYSQIITIIQKEGKIVFLPVQMEATIENTPQAPSTLLWVGPDPAWNPLQSPGGQPWDSPTARPCWCILRGISLSAATICSGRRGDKGLEPLPARADPPVGDGHQSLMWRGRDRSGIEGKVLNCSAFVRITVSVRWVLVAGSHPLRSWVLWASEEAELAGFFPS